MTPDQIDNMTDRERNALVAEKVMGWPIIDDEPWEHGDHDIIDRTPCVTNWWVAIDGNKCAMSGYQKYFRPFTDLADDFSVLNHVREKGLRRLSNSHNFIYGFHEALSGILRDRMSAAGAAVGGTYTDIWLMLYYRVGDFARAALHVALSAAAGAGETGQEDK